MNASKVDVGSENLGKKKTNLHYLKVKNATN